jgi:hypothetical protein
MINNAIFRKSSRIAGAAAVLGASAALLLIGAPADAATVQSGATSMLSSAARGISVGYARGI